MIVDARELTLAEKERLIKLCQECGEVIQAATKALMYGWAPQFQGVSYDNRGDVQKELADVINVQQLMHQRGDLNEFVIYETAWQKMPKMLAHMRYQHVAPPTQEVLEDEEPDFVTYFPE